MCVRVPIWQRLMLNTCTAMHECCVSGPSLMASASRSSSGLENTWRSVLRRFFPQPLDRNFNARGTKAPTASATPAVEQHVSRPLALAMGQGLHAPAIVSSDCSSLKETSRIAVYFVSGPETTQNQQGVTQSEYREPRAQGATLEIRLR